MKKLIASLFVHIILIGTVFSQEIKWQKVIGGSSLDHFKTMIQTSDGGYLVGGYSYSSISFDKTENNIGGDDYWIVKTDAEGIIQWQNTIGGTGYDELTTMNQTSDGGYIIGGYSSSDSLADKSENCLGVWDYWLVKVDANGLVQWNNTIGGNQGDWLYYVEQTNDGGYILAGGSKSGISGDKTENNFNPTLSSADYWIVKTDASGNVQWENTIGGNDIDYPCSIHQTSDGGYIVGGTSLSNISGDKTEDSYNGDFWIVKLDATGAIQWQNTIGGYGQDQLITLKIANDGGYLLGGNSWSNISADKTENCRGLDDYWVVKTDATGNIQWQKTIGGSGFDDLYSIREANDGGYILAGSSKSNFSGDKQENSYTNYYDYWVVKLDSLRNIQWQNTIGGSGSDELYCVLQENNNEEGYVLGGWSDSNTSLDKTDTCKGVRDYWIMKTTNKYNFITGKLYNDVNANSVQDSGEASYKHKMIKEQNTGRFTFSQWDGRYRLLLPDTGSYTFSTNIPVFTYYTVTPATHSSTFMGFQQTDSLKDFMFQPLGTFNDLCVTLTPLGNFRSGRKNNYMITYENVGTTTLTPTIIFFPDNDLTFVTSNPMPTTVYNDSVVWTLPPLAPFQNGSILVTVQVNMSTGIGDSINSYVRIDPIVFEANLACNYSFSASMVTGGYDPNAILVDRDTISQPALVNPPYLDYIIYFQNTGNDTAFNVKVLNPIDTNFLDISSLEFLASSHPVNLNWINYQRNMEFKFEDILLPDSNINEPASHGFVRYHIKPKSNLVAGDSISNFAAIYFDFNAPVLTNTAVTSIILPTGLNHIKTSEHNITVYPNPARDEVIVSCSWLKVEKADLKIMDLFGRIIYSAPFTAPTQKIQIGKIPSGIYFLEINNDKYTARVKFIKE